MLQFTASSCPTATSGPPPLVISPELLADPALSWVERVLLARIFHLHAEGGCAASTAELAHYLEREASTVRNLIAGLVKRGYLRPRMLVPSLPFRQPADFSAMPPEDAVLLQPLPTASLPPFSEPLENQRPEPEITLEIQASGDPWRTVPASESLPLRGRNAKAGSSSKVPDLVDVPEYRTPATDQNAARLPAPSATPEAAETAPPPAAAVSCKQAEREGETRQTSGPPFDLPEPSQGASRLLAAGVNWPMAADLAERCDLARIEGAIARQKREGKGIGWLVMCLKEGWTVDTPPAPRMPHNTPRGDSAAVIATRADNADRLPKVRPVLPAADEDQFQAAFNRLGRQLAMERTEAEAPPSFPAGRRRPVPAEPPAADLATCRARRDLPRQEMAA